MNWVVRQTEGFFNRQRVSRIRRTRMGVRVEVRDGESVEQAYKRFKELLWRHGPPGAGRKRPKWHKRPLDHYLKPSELARRDKLRDAFETYAGECARRRLVWRDPPPHEAPQGAVRGRTGGVQVSCAPAPPVVGVGRAPNQSLRRTRPRLLVFRCFSVYPSALVFGPGR